MDSHSSCISFMKAKLPKSLKVYVSQCNEGMEHKRFTKQLHTSAHQPSKLAEHT